MRYPNLQIEKKLWQQGYQHIAGVDEAGRGAWAGPIVAAAVIMDPKRPINGLKDSKILSAKKREDLFQTIVDRSLGVATAVIDCAIIDNDGLTAANHLALKMSLANLKVLPDYFLIDAYKLAGLNAPSQSIISGDYKVSSIAAASIIAKVTRDRLMITFDKDYPQYNFKSHKGYGTKEHHLLIKRFGVCLLHRRSFRPIKDLLQP